MLTHNKFDVLQKDMSQVFCMQSPQLILCCNMQNDVTQVEPGAAQVFFGEM